MRVLVVLLGLLAATTAGYLAFGAAPSRREVEPPKGVERRPPPAPAPTREKVEAGIRRGVEYLVKAQNKDGSWGSPASNLWDIYAPVPGSYYAFEVAASGLAVSALLEVGGDVSGAAVPGVTEALRRGTDFLLAHHTRARRVSEDTLYNVWAHAYALEAFARLLAVEKDPARREALTKASREAVDLLVRFEFVDGGWGYYNFAMTVQRPEHGATSFTTATVLVALKMAAEQGIEVPPRLVTRALALIEICRKPDWAFAYSWDHRYFPQGRINHVQGSLARTPACQRAFEMWGRKVPTDRIEEALDHLDEQGYFLLIARKYPIPHEAWYQNSGYFCFYGYYYAAQLLERVSATDRERHQDLIARTLVPLQEEDGSWWDYQLYSYHKAYGTAYVLMTLHRCLH